MVNVKQSNKTCNKFQGYQSRSPEQWRLNARGGGIGKQEAARLAKLLNVANRSVNLSDWDHRFCMDLDERFAKYGEGLVLSPKQRQQAERIESKLRKSGRL
jgi:hypothetical protein